MAAELLGSSRVSPPSPAKTVPALLLRIVQELPEFVSWFPHPFLHPSSFWHISSNNRFHFAGYQFAEADTPTAVTGPPAPPATVVSCASVILIQNTDSKILIQYISSSKLCISQQRQWFVHHHHQDNVASFLLPPGGTLCSTSRKLGRVWAS